MLNAARRSRAPKTQMAHPSDKGQATANLLTTDTAEDTVNTPLRQTKTISIRPAEQGDGFDVVVMPVAPWNGVDRHNLPTVRAAKRAAESLSMVHGWKVADVTVGDAA